LTSIPISQNRKDVPEWLTAFGVSIAIHIFLFMLLAYAAVLYVVTKEPAFPKEEEVSEERVVTMTPDFFERLVEEPPPALNPVREQEQRFARTSAQQEVENQLTETRYIGERNTEAATEMLAADSALAVPTQVGEEPKKPEQVETINDQFADGETGEASEVPEPAELLSDVEPALGDFSSPSPSDVPEPSPKPQDDGAPPIPEQKNEQMTDTPVEQVEAEKKEFMETQQARELPEEKMSEGVPQEGERKEPQKDRPKEKTSQESFENTSPERRSEGGATGSEVKKTSIQGNISRRGTSSLAVKKTALGRYQAAVGRAVEKEWQKRCLQYREHITPGYLTVRFIVSAKGEVANLNFVESSQSGNIQNGFTLLSIQNAEIPVMPKELTSQQNGKPIDMVFSFTF